MNGRAGGRVMRVQPLAFGVEPLTGGTHGSRRSRGLLRTRWLQAMAIRPGACLSLIYLVMLVGAAVLAPWLTPYPAEGAGAPNMAHKLLAPSLAHPFGTDEMGRDLLSRVLFGARTSLALAMLVVGASMICGVVVGLLAGTAGGWTDEAAMRMTDIFLAFPPLLLAIMLATVLGRGLIGAALALTLTWWPVYAILVRGQVRRLRELPFVEAARAIGGSPLHIALRHLLPNALGPLFVQATLDVGVVIVIASGLSFVGLGSPPPSADWGMMINSGRQYVLSGSWWAASFPGAAILLTALAFAVLGDGLRDAANPDSHG